MTVALGSVIDYLVATFTTAAGVEVFDGPQPAAVRTTEWVLVGGTETDDDVAVVLQEFSDLGPGTWRDETGEVACTAWSSAGGTDLPARRAAAFDVAQLCADAVHADRSLGGLLINSTGRVSELRYQSVQTDKGAVARVLFTVSYQALIST